MLSVWNLGNDCWTAAGQDCFVRGAAQSGWSLFSALVHPTSPCLKEPLKKIGEKIWADLRKQVHIVNRCLGEIWRQKDLHGDAAQLAEAMAWPQGCVCAASHGPVHKTAVSEHWSFCYQAWWREKCAQKLTSIWASVGISLDIPHLEEMGVQHPQLSAKKWKKIRRSLSCCCPVITFMKYVLFSFLSIMRLNGLFYVEKWALCIPAQSHAGAEAPNGDFAGYI